MCCPTQYCSDAPPSLNEGEDKQMEDNEIPQMAGADNVHGQTRRANIVDRFF